jgi:phenylacetate-CoA ligase
MGARPGTRVMDGAGSGARPDSGRVRAFAKLGAVRILGDRSNLEMFAVQMSYLKPEVLAAFPGFLEGLTAAAARAGLSLGDLLEPIRHVWWAGSRLHPLLRRSLEETYQAEVHEIYGLADLGFHGMDCPARAGCHVQEDFFILENLDPATGQPVDDADLGQLVITSLWDEGMNIVRWESEDAARIDRRPCACGRTSPRVNILGRVWERTVVEGRSFMPTEVEGLLIDLVGRETTFQIVRPRAGDRPPTIRVALPDDVGVEDVRAAVRADLGVDVEVERSTAAVIRAGSPVYKYRQLIDAD